MRQFFSPTLNILLATVFFFICVYFFYDTASENEALCINQEGRWNAKTQACGLEPGLGLF